MEHRNKANADEDRRDRRDGEPATADILPFRPRRNVPAPVGGDDDDGPGPGNAA